MNFYGHCQNSFWPPRPPPPSNGYVGAPFRTLFFLFLWTPWHQKWEHRVCILQTMSICNGYWILHSQASGRSVWSSLHIISDVLAETRWLLGCSNLKVLNFFWRCIMTQTDRQLFGYFHFGGCWTPYLSNCITLVKIFFWKHRVNFVHYVLLPTEQAETYLKIYYLTHILRWVVKKNMDILRSGWP